MYWILLLLPNHLLLVLRINIRLRLSSQLLYKGIVEKAHSQRSLMNPLVRPLCPENLGLSISQSKLWVPLQWLETELFLNFCQNHGKKSTCQPTCRYMHCNERWQKKAWVWKCKLIIIPEWSTNGLKRETYVRCQKKERSSASVNKLRARLPRHIINMNSSTWTQVAESIKHNGFRTLFIGIFCKYRRIDI